MLNCCIKRHLILYPILSSLTILSGFILTYIIAVSLEHVNAFIPSISSTGEYPPENSLFTLTTALASFFMLTTGAIRCREIWDSYFRYNFIVQTFNFIGFFILFLSVLGLILVGSFDISDVEVILVHFTGAIMVYLAGLAYFVIQSVLGIFLKPYFWWRIVILVIRSILILFASICLVLYIGFRQNSPTTDSSSPHPYFIVSNGSQWFFVSSLVALFLTMVPEFYTLELNFEVVYKTWLHWNRYQL